MSVNLNSSQLYLLAHPQDEMAIKRVFSFAKKHPNSMLQVFSFDDEPSIKEEEEVYEYSDQRHALLALFSLSLSAAASKITQLGNIILKKKSACSVFVGALIFIAITKVWNNFKKIQESIEYQQIKFVREQQNKSASLQLFLKSDNVLKHLLCTLTKTIPICPVHSPDGKIYEYKYIRNWIEDHPNTPIPSSKNVFPIKELQIDFSHANAIQIRLKELIQICNIYSLSHLESCLNQQLPNNIVKEILLFLGERDTEHCFVKPCREMARRAKEMMDGILLEIHKGFIEAHIDKKIDTESYTKYIYETNLMSKSIKIVAKQ